MRYLDTNIFIRYLTNDHPIMSPAAAALFASIADEKEGVIVLESTVAEVVYVLSSPRFYDISILELRDRLTVLLSTRGIVMEHKARCLRALDLCATYPVLNFGDAIVAAAAEEQPERGVYSYDRGFDRVEGVRRVEP
jgi:predicted nucleic acid-binding protein